MFHRLEDDFSVPVSNLPRRLQDFFAKLQRRLPDVITRHLLLEVFKMSSRCLQDVFKRSWETKNVRLKTLQDVFKMYSPKRMFAGISPRGWVESSRYESL